MPEFEFDVNAELAGMRGHTPKPVVRVQPTQQHGGNTATAPPPSEPQGGQSEPDVAEPEGLKVTQSHQEVLGGNAGTSSDASDPINWKQFKTMPGIFEHVGGDRPVRLNPKIRKSQVSGIPEPMLGVTQAYLRDKYVGAVLAFPWGEYTITDKNRVFTTKSSLVRYLLFDSLRDTTGLHVQYAKQWLVLQHPAFDVGFNPDTHLSPTNDELDIYVLLYVAHSSSLDAGEYGVGSSRTQANSEQDYQTAERIGMLNMGLTRVLDKLQAQEKAFEEYAQRNQMTQTVMMLDRMGLLKGGLPKDVGEFVRVLEQNRDALSQTGSIIDNHISAEESRRQTLARQSRMTDRRNQND